MSLNSPIFYQSLLKVERAKRHIFEVETRFLEYVHSDFWSIVTQEDAERTRFWVEVTQEVPPELSMAVGDALHSLRASLEYLIHQIMANTGTSGNTRASFPVHETREALIADFNSSDHEAKPCPTCGRGGRKGRHNPIKVAVPDIVPIIIDGIKPYKTGNPSDDRGLAIWRLNKIDNINKHRLIIPSVQITEVEISADAENGGRIRGNRYRLTGQNRSLGVTLWGKLKFTDECQAAATILFPKGSYFDGEPIIPTLHQIVDFTTSVINTFEAHFQRGDGTGG